MSSFASIRAETRAQEGACDALLTQLSELVGSAVDTAALETELEANLAGRTALVRELHARAGEPDAGRAAAHQAQRHAATLDDQRRTARRLRSAAAQERNRQQLLSSVRRDIQTHRGGLAGASSAAEQTADAERYYGDERARVDASHSVVDTLLASAYEARAEMVRQQQTLRDVQRRMLHVLARVPGVNTLISKINTRQKRNSLVLAGVLVCCVLFLVFVR